MEKRQALFEAAKRLAAENNDSIGDIFIETIAREAGMSRSTALRRLGGTRKPIDDALAQLGIDTTGQPSVRVRAIDAAGQLIAEKGLSTTMAEIAAKAGCSTESLYLTFGTRTELLEQTFIKFSPLEDLREFFQKSHGTFTETVHAFYQMYAQALTRQPQVMPALVGQAISHPCREPNQHTTLGIPDVIDIIGPWLRKEVAAGNLKPYPISTLLHQLVGPPVLEMLSRPVFNSFAPELLSPVEETATEFAELFLCAAATDPGAVQ
ncbi:TetR/AcrR family transcriptional regulator [Staphylococcus chromogenes]|nr:TetR/AcrR family transcriptional regulator [Staphylococcus chromogenes]